MNATINAAPTKEEVAARANEFRARLESFLNDHAGGKLPYTFVITLESGPKNIRVVRAEKSAKTGEMLEHSRTAYCFIDAATGAILKTAGWKAPAKGVRGSIFKEDFDIGQGKACGPYGAAYLR